MWVVGVMLIGMKPLVPQSHNSDPSVVRAPTTVEKGGTLNKISDISQVKKWPYRSNDLSCGLLPNVISLKDPAQYQALIR